MVTNVAVIDSAKCKGCTMCCLLYTSLCSPEQLTEIFRCCADSVEEDFFELTDMQEEMIRGIQQQIRVCVPDLDERVRQQEDVYKRQPLPCGAAARRLP